MVKLLRLSSNNSTSLFDSTFNEDIILKPQSKVALKSLSIETKNDILIIDNFNSTIDFQVSTGFVKSFNLAHNTYSNNNFNDLLLEIQTNLNKNTGFDLNDFEVRRNYGLEWLAHIDTDKKVSVGYDLGTLGEYPNNWNYDTNLVERVTTNNGTWKQKSTVPPSNTNTRSVLFNTYISKGCSYIRCRTARFDNNLSIHPASNGYIIGLSTTNISALEPDEITDDMLTYGIAVSCDSANIRKYFSVINGVYNLSAVVPVFIGNNDVNNDFQEVIKNFENIELNVYQNGSDIKISIGVAPAVAEQKLYPYIVFRGPNCSLNNLRTIPSPYSNITQSASVDLGAPPQPARNPSNNFIQFSQSLAEFLGFKNARQPQVNFINDVTVNYQADTIFKAEEIADSFIVEALNLKLESYDAFLNQRKNIIAVVPKSNETGVIIYESENPVFIDLNNKNEILLRNLKIRVVRPDYSQVSQLGQSTLVLLID